jgi:hypothetical protein
LCSTEPFACLGILSENSYPKTILLTKKDVVECFQFMFIVQCHIPSTTGAAFAYYLPKSKVDELFCVKFAKFLKKMV